LHGQQQCGYENIATQLSDAFPHRCIPSPKRLSLFRPQL
jgi:hypothetical protein